MIEYQDELLYIFRVNWVTSNQGFVNYRIRPWGEDSTSESRFTYALDMKIRCNCQTIMMCIVVHRDAIFRNYCTHVTRCIVMQCLDIIVPVSHNAPWHVCLTQTRGPHSRTYGTCMVKAHCKTPSILVVTFVKHGKERVTLSSLLRTTSSKNVI